MNHAAEFQRIGKRLREEGLVSANFGNMSVRKGDGLLITRNGAFLDSPGELVYVAMAGAIPQEASSECKLHREVYRITPHHAVVHAHPPHAVATSLHRDRIVPVDSEGVMFCPSVPVVTGLPGSMEMAENVASALKDHKVVIVRGHGTVCGAGSLEEGYVLTSIVEHSCRVLLLSWGGCD
ncbi:MAG TPA: aldolase [Methanolinea sp.]|nr:MAG: L-fuculose phosphate aldolase [Methanoregulaceae archaeon PtaB.Bin009]HII76203.1 aldolase [Methanolinea sp.]